MFYDFSLPGNNGKEETILYLQIGVITSIDTENYHATVNTNHGVRTNVRICFPHYSRGSGIFIMPSIGDICAVGVTSERESYMLAFYSLNPRSEMKGQQRIIPNPHTYVIHTVAGDSISVSKDSNTPNIDIESKGKKNTVKLSLAPASNKIEKTSFNLATDNISIAGIEEDKKLDLLAQNGKITIKVNDNQKMELDSLTGATNMQANTSTQITSPNIVLAGNVSFGGMTASFSNNSIALKPASSDLGVNVASGIEFNFNNSTPSPVITANMLTAILTKLVPSTGYVSAAEVGAAIAEVTNQSLNQNVKA